MTKIIQFIIAQKHLFVALFFTVIMVLYAQFVLGYFSECFRMDDGPNSLGLTFSYNQSDVLSFFSVRTSDQLICYGHFLRVWDTIFPVFYTLMYCFWFRYFFKMKPILLLFPIAHMCLDWAENYTELLMMDEFFSTAEISTTTVNIGSMLTSFKWVFSGITYLIILYGIFLKVRGAIVISRKR